MREADDSVDLSIRKPPGVIGGDACIGNTRIAVWMLVEMRKLGASDAELLRDYPQLTQKHLDLAWDYYERNRDEIERNLADQDAAMRDD
jgi:uncharacterized protein (DUF433 family)